MCMCRNIVKDFGIGKQNGFEDFITCIFDRHAAKRFFERIIAFVLVVQFKKHRIAIVSIRNQLVTFEFYVLAFTAFVNAGCYCKATNQTTQNEVFHASKLKKDRKLIHTAFEGFLDDSKESVCIGEHKDSYYENEG